MQTTRVVAGSQNIRVFVLLSAAYFVNLIKQKRFVCVFFAATVFAGHVKWESAYLIAVAEPDSCTTLNMLSTIGPMQLTWMLLLWLLLLLLVLVMFLLHMLCLSFNDLCR